MCCCRNMFILVYLKIPNSQIIMPIFFKGFLTHWNKNDTLAHVSVLQMFSS